MAFGANVGKVRSPAPYGVTPGNLFKLAGGRSKPCPLHASICWTILKKRALMLESLKARLDRQIEPSPHCALVFSISCRRSRMVMPSWPPRTPAVRGPWRWKIILGELEVRVSFVSRGDGAGFPPAHCRTGSSQAFTYLSGETRLRAFDELVSMGYIRHMCLRGFPCTLKKSSCGLSSNQASPKPERLSSLPKKLSVRVAYAVYALG